MDLFIYTYIDVCSYIHIRIHTCVFINIIMNIPQGFGGHTKEIVNKLIPYKKWKHVGIDQDITEFTKTKERVINFLTLKDSESVNTDKKENSDESIYSNADFLRSRISFHHQNFGDIEELGKSHLTVFYYCYRFFKFWITS